MLRLSNVNTRILQEASEKYDVYVVTYKRYAKMVPYLGNVKNVTYMEDLPYESAKERVLQRLNSTNSSFLQFQKLLIAFENMNQVEEAEGFKYDRVLKTRTEMLYSPDFKWESLFNLFDEDHLYMYTDVMFGAKRDIMETVSQFFIYAMLRYWDDYKYQSINLDNIEECDLAAGRFDILKFPKEVINERHDLNTLKNLLIENKIRIDEINKTNRYDVLVYCGLKDWDSFEFLPEVSLAHYVLDKGLIVKQFPANSPKLPAVPIRRNIENIIESINNNDLEFLVNYVFTHDEDASTAEKIQIVLSVVEVYRPELAAPYINMCNKLAKAAKATAR